MAARSDRIPELISQKQAAELLGVTSPALSHWVRNGELTPERAEGRTRLYRSTTVLEVAAAKGHDVRHLLERLPAGLQRESGAAGALDYQQIRAEHEAVKLALSELRLAERRGELLDAQRVRDGIGAGMAAIRERVMAIETRAAGEMPAESLAWLAVEIRAALSQATDDAEAAMARVLGEPSDDAEDDDA